MVDILLGCGVLVLYATVLVAVHNVRRLVLRRFDGFSAELATTERIGVLCQTELLRRLADINAHLDVAVKRIADFEGKPAEVVKIEVPIVPANATVQQIGVGACVVGVV